MVRAHGRGITLALLALLAAPISAAAQGNRPLTKTDLIQLITSRNRTQSDVVEVIRRNCLTFTPTARDLRDLRVQGAGAAVLEAVENCTRAPGPLRLVVPARVRATAGQQVTVPVRVLRDGQAVAGVSVLLRGAAAIPGGSAQEPGGVSDARGVARITLLAGVQPGTYPLEVSTADASTPPVALQLVTVAAGTGLLAAVRPTVIRLRQGSRSGAAVQVSVQDKSGRPVPGVHLELDGISAQIDTGLRAVTDPRGVATFVIPPGAVRHGGQVGVFYAGTPIATVDMLLENVVLSGFRTQFTSGTDQRGTVHTTLRQPLVFEVRDTTGMRVLDYPVHFAVVNGSVVPADTTTDTAGVARVMVTLGSRTGPVTVTATAGTVRKEASLYATPGPAMELVVQRGGQPIDSVLTIASRDSVGLRVVARDAFGNDALLEGLQVSVSGRAGAVALRSLRGGGAPGAVVLEPRRGGTAALAVRASGLARTIPIVVDLPVHGTPWVLGALAGGAAFSYGYQPAATNVDGRPGFRLELTAGRRVGPPGLRVEGGLGLGVLRAASTAGANLAVPLFQGLVRGEYAFLPHGGEGGGSGVVPVVTLGGGLYRIKSTDAANMVYHTSLFWLIGAGVEWTLGPQLKGVARLERQQLYEANSSHPGADGSVGALTILEVGVRYSP
jgi:hypothetical protein